MKTYRIATIPGDGIGKEVVPAGQKVMEALHGYRRCCSLLTASAQRKAA